MAGAGAMTGGKTNTGATTGVVGRLGCNGDRLRSALCISTQNRNILQQNSTFTTIYRMNTSS
jgi:hypothetical protein